MFSRCLECMYYKFFGKIMFYLVAVCHISAACINIYCCKCLQNSESGSEDNAEESEIVIVSHVSGYESDSEEEKDDDETVVASHVSNREAGSEDDDEDQGIMIVLHVSSDESDSSGGESSSDFDNDELSLFRACSGDGTSYDLYSM